VPAKVLYATRIIALICLTHALATRSALAITAEVAKKCQGLATQAYPLRVPGNPAAGRTHGTAEGFRDYFNKCVANGGNVPEQPAKQEDEKNAPAPSPK
jgi:hypothetical protein